jgi:hypothetical protein
VMCIGWHPLHLEKMAVPFYMHTQLENDRALNSENAIHLNLDFTDSGAFVHAFSGFCLLVCKGVCPLQLSGGAHMFIRINFIFYRRQLSTRR